MTVDTRANFYRRTISEEAEVMRYFTDIAELQKSHCETRRPLLKRNLSVGTLALVGEMVGDADTTQSRELVANTFAKLNPLNSVLIHSATRAYFLRSTNLDQAWPLDSRISDKQARNFLGMPQK